MHKIETEQCSIYLRRLLLRYGSPGLALGPGLGLSWSALSKVAVSLPLERLRAILQRSSPWVRPNVLYMDGQRRLPQEVLFTSLYGSDAVVRAVGGRFSGIRAEDAPFLREMFYHMMLHKRFYQHTTQL